jgi:hypothetical protein
MRCFINRDTWGFESQIRGMHVPKSSDCRYPASTFAMIFVLRTHMSSNLVDILAFYDYGSIERLIL